VYLALRLFFFYRHEDAVADTACVAGPRHRCAQRLQGTHQTACLFLRLSFLRLCLVALLRFCFFAFLRFCGCVCALSRLRFCVFAFLRFCAFAAAFLRFRGCVSALSRLRGRADAHAQEVEKQFALVEQHILRLRGCIALRDSEIVIMCERNLGFESEHLQRALNGLPPTCGTASTTRRSATASS